MSAHHYFGRDIQIRYLVGLGDERGGPGSPGVGLDDENMIIFYGELNIDQPFLYSVPWRIPFLP